MESTVSISSFPRSSGLTFVSAFANRILVIVGGDIVILGGLVSSFGLGSKDPTRSDDGFFSSESLIKNSKLSRLKTESTIS
mgnify:CR=1 FL=1